MERIISDTYAKQNKTLWSDDLSDPFNKRILAVNEMYGWLYKHGILEQISFVFKDYGNMTYFALDTKELLPYRKAMECSGLENAKLAVSHIFDEEYTPCRYSGAIQLGWPMATYRSVDDTVGRSWECSLVVGLGTKEIYDVLDVKESKGVKEAVKAAFQEYNWRPTITDKQELFQAAVAYFRKVSGTEFLNSDDYSKFPPIYANKVIYCYENKKDLIDFDSWVRYEELCNEPMMTFDEYKTFDSSFDGDPHDVKESDLEVVSSFKKKLTVYRESKLEQNSSIKMYGCSGKYFYVVQQHKSYDAEYFSLYSIDKIPNDMSKENIEKFLLENASNGSSVAGTFEQVMEELESFFKEIRSDKGMSLADLISDAENEKKSHEIGSNTPDIERNERS